MANKLDKILDAKSIAVIGASNERGTVGYALIQNLIGSGYEGIVYPVNIKAASIQGVKSYRSIEEIDDSIDLAVIATPAKTVPNIVKQCGEKGVGGLVIISAGFKEVGEQGIAMSQEILKMARNYDMRIIGPNCLGVINPAKKLNASFAKSGARPGKIAFISQSGALCTAILDWANEQNVGFSHFVSIGSMIDVGFHDLIDYFGSDPRTSSILIYMESLTDARRFISAARAFSRSKPIIVLKAGKSAEGAQATMSHTGSLAGNDAAFDAAFRRAGIIRVNTISQLFHCAQSLAMQNRPKGNRLAIVTNAGGPGVLATDALMENGGQLAKLTDETMAKLNKALPSTWSHNNPVDVLGDASSERYSEATEVCLKDPNVDGVVVILTPQAMTNPSDVAQEMVRLSRNSEKTLLTAWMGETDVQKARDILEMGDVPTYRYPESAVRVFLNMYDYSRNIELLYETPGATPHEFQPNREAARELIHRVQQENRERLTEAEGKKLFELYQIPVTQSVVVQSAQQAAEVGERIGFPVVMKIVSSDIGHKTDVGGVVLNVQTPEGAKKSYDKILASVRQHMPEAKIDGILVEEMAKKRYEVLIGAKKDPIFGPVIVFGMGGVAVEIFKDMHVGLPPLNMALAMRLIEETKIFKLLRGFRGLEGVDMRSIQFLLYKFAYLVMDFPEIREIDINPFVVDASGGIVLDANVVLDRDMFGKTIKPYSHLVISPYPHKYVTEFTLADGRQVALRPIRPEDEPMEAEMFTRLSQETQYFRFFGYVPDVTHDLLTRYTQIDYDREIAIIAEVTEGQEKKMAGVVRLVHEIDDLSGEFAIVVADPWQGQGLGNKFTDYMIEIAKKRGLKKVYANVLKANNIMIHMFERRGFKIEAIDIDSCYAELSIDNN